MNRWILSHISYLVSGSDVSKSSLENQMKVRKYDIGGIYGYLMSYE